jgi:glucoamylase
MTHLARRIFSFVIAVQLVIACGACLSAHVRAESLGEWIRSEKDAATRKLIAAIGRNGAVIASPDESTPNQNYFFHWTRDAALTMNVVVGLYENAPAGELRNEYARILRKYVQFSRRNQTDPQPSGLTGLGEPKFRVDGSVFSAPWGRPQNDGPALRSITLCRWANLLLDQHHDEAIVEAEIMPAVVSDLEYVRQHWDDKGFDLWEEVRGKHFYTRMVERRALLDGAKLFDRLDKGELATACRDKVPGLESAILQHFDAPAGCIKETLDADGDAHGKVSQHDSAIVLATLHGETADQPFFAPVDDRVLATAAKLRDDFVHKFVINQGQNPTDVDGEPMEPGIGRYPEDKYNGANDDEGNPWFLLTAAFAEHAYRTRDIFTKAQTICVTERNRDYLSACITASGSTATLAAGDSVAIADPRFKAITKGLSTIGDRYLRRVRRHGAVDGSFSEQFRGSNGFMTGAVDLTWSYAAVLTAFDRR